MKMSLTDYALIAGAVAVGYSIYKTSQAIDVVSDVVTNDLNPASNENIVNKGVSKVGAEISGNPNWTLGGWIYDVTHPKEDLKPNNPQSNVEAVVGNTVNLYEEDVL